MYHSVLFMKNRGVAVIVASAVMASLWSSAAHADILKCQRTLVKEATKVERKRAKALRKCYDAALKAGTASPVCPDPDNAAKILAAETKFHDKVTGDCAAVTVADVGFSGLVSRCVGGNNDTGLCLSNADCPGVPTPGVCTAADECPDLYNGNLAASCSAPLASTGDVADCLICNGSNVVSGPIEIAYKHDPIPLPSIEPEPKHVLKCQRNVGKSTAKYFDKVRKSLSKCKDAALKAGSGTCPDAAASTSIADALTKFQEKVAKDCDATTFPNGLNRANIFDSIVIPVSVPGPVPAVDAFDNYRDTLSQTIEQLASCSSDLGTGNFAPGCQPLCGNGKIDAGETCDDGNQLNGDSCPSDCTVTTCSTGGSVTATVNFTPPAGVDLAGIQVLVGYPDDLVKIPGSGNSIQVLNRVTATDGSAALAVNDLNYAIRLLVNTDGSVAIAGAPSLATIDFDTGTGAAAVADGDFACIVQDTSAFGPVADQVFATTCSVDVP